MRRLPDSRVLTQAEQAVIARLETGHVTLPGDDMPGPDAGETRRVRASLVRWLALSAPGDAKIHLHEKGLQIRGALIVSDGAADPDPRMASTLGLDLSGCAVPHDIG